MTLQCIYFIIIVPNLYQSSFFFDQLRKLSWNVGQKYTHLFTFIILGHDGN